MNPVVVSPGRRRGRLFILLIVLLLAWPLLGPARAQGQRQLTEKIVAGEGNANDRFGTSVAASGDRALVGAFFDDDNGIQSGSAYVFERQSDGTWTEAFQLLADGGVANEQFGTSVALDGDRAVVGASGTGAGAAYVFERQGDGAWAQTAQLTAADGASGDRFGTAVALAGDRALVGASFDDDDGSASGSAYVFERQGDGTWAQAAKLTAADAAAEDNFGTAVALDGARALVGAYLDDDEGNGTGSAYVFERQGDGTWAQATKLTAPDVVDGAGFGGAVALGGDRALVGAYFDLAGSAHVFERQGDGTWARTARLDASDGALEDFFGFDVALAGDQALIGAHLDDDNGAGSGAAYLFRRTEGDTWVEASKLTAADGAPDDQFGIAVAVTDVYLLVGAYLDDDQGVGSGSVYAGLVDAPLAVELTSFRGVADGADVVLTWTTAGEDGHAGFAVEHRPAAGGAWRQAAFVPGAGTTAEARTYAQRVTGLAPGRHAVRLRLVDVDGRFTYSPAVEVEVGLPSALRVDGAFPNPFASSATLRFAVREAGPVRVVLFDVLGRAVRVLYAGTPGGGAVVDVPVDGSALPAGVYVVRVVTGAGQATQVLVKR